MRCSQPKRNSILNGKELKVLEITERLVKENRGLTQVEARARALTLINIYDIILKYLGSN